MAEAGGIPAWRRFWSADVRRRTVVTVLAAGWLLAVGSLVVPELVTSDAARDTRDVFCLQTGEQDALADAAVALGLAQPGSTPDNLLLAGDTAGDTADDTVTVHDWRRDHNADFVRACDALSSVRGKATPSGGGLGGVVLPVVTLVLTSALTYATTRRQRRSDQGENDAVALRGAVDDYTRAATEFLDSRVSFPADLPPAAMDAARDALVGRLNGIAARRPDWIAVRDVVTLLRDGELGTSLDAGLRAHRDATTRLRAIGDLRARVAHVSDTGYLVADAIAEHGSVHRRLTRPNGGLT